jgi:hypothetical protein
LAGKRTLQAHTALLNTRDRTALRDDVVITDVYLCRNAVEVATSRDFDQAAGRRPVNTVSI